ncbi:MAG: substrate-binding domain-containing protein, partial [Gammaproteobacteria bacterium]|nr:substrate-binding domain-containing protein [Gammaproteobacteria bacterium]
FKYWQLETPAKQLRQFAVQLTRTEQPAAAQNFLAFLVSPSAQKIIETAGYRLPKALR